MQIKEKIVIYGCGGHARSVYNSLMSVLLSNTDICFVDENAKPGERIYGRKVLPKILLGKETSYFVAIGDNLTREKVSRILISEGATSEIMIVSNTAIVSEFSNIDKGVFIAEKTYIGPNSSIGRGTIVNTGAVIEHEVKIGEYCHISCNSTVCGRSEVGNRVFIGAGATVIDKVSICSDVIIGAGGVVVEDITNPGIYVGVPVKRI